MAEIYVDSVIGTSSQYDPITRSSTGGSYNSYATFGAAHTAAQAGDIIWVRSGGESLTNFTTTKAVKWRIYKDEIYTITSNSVSTTAPFTCTTVACDADFGIGQLIIKDAGQTLANNMPAVRLGFAGSKVNGIRFDWNNGCLVTLAASSTTFTMDRCVLKNSTHQRGFNQAASSNIVNMSSWVFENSNGIGQTAANMTLNFYNPTIVGLTTGSALRKMFEATSSSCIINVYNPIAIGCMVDDINASKYLLEQSGSGQLNIYGGILHSHMFSRSLLSTGTITNTSNSNSLVKFLESNPCRVAICLQDSSWATTLGTEPITDPTVFTLTNMLSMLSSYPEAKLNYFPDDHQYWNAEHVSQINAWIAAGHELGSWGISGSDNWNINTPFTANYSGSETNVRLVITNEGQTWAVVADSGTLAGPYDCSLNGPWRDMGVYNAIENSGGSTAVLRQIELDVPNLTISLGPGNSGTGGFDDAAASMISDGDYTLPASPPIDRNRRILLEVDRSKSLTYQHLGIYPTVFYCNGTGTNTDVGTYCQNNGWTGFLDNGLTNRLRQQADNFNQYNIYRGLGTTGTSALFGTSEDDIRAGARVLASWGMYYGAFIPLVFTNSSPLTAAQFGYLIDELLLCGVEIVTFSEAIDKKATTNIPVRTNYSLAENSAGAGSSTRFWTPTSARKYGINKEPYPDIDIDCGAAPWPRGIFHPKNKQK